MLAFPKALTHTHPHMRVKISCKLCTPAGTDEDKQPQDKTGNESAPTAWQTAESAEQEGSTQAKKQQRNGGAATPVGGVRVLNKSSKAAKALGPGRRIDFLTKHLKQGGVQVRSGEAESGDHDHDGPAANVRALETWHSLQVGEHLWMVFGEVCMHIVCVRHKK